MEVYVGVLGSMEDMSVILPLLESLTGVSEPACFVPTTRVVMCPMNYATLFIPLEHAIECDGITGF